MAQQLPARPADYVVDLAGVIDRGTLQQLNGYLQELERKTGAQMIVLTVSSTQGTPIREFSLKTAEQWKLGRKDRNDGVLVVIAIKDRKWAFEVGYGLEPTLTDGFCGRLGREVFAPYFKKGDYSRGIYEGALVLASAVAGAAGVNITGMPARTLPHGRAMGGLGACVSALAPILLLFAVLSALFGRRYSTYRNRHCHDSLWLWLVLGALSGSRHGHSNWGGGSWGGFGGGGSFGGGSFGGGGGGSFGGGGASGGW
jgi:uncharacterized protein